MTTGIVRKRLNLAPFWQVHFCDGGRNRPRHFRALLRAKYTANLKIEVIHEFAP